MLVCLSRLFKSSVLVRTFFVCKGKANNGLFKSGSKGLKNPTVEFLAQLDPGAQESCHLSGSPCVVTEQALPAPQQQPTSLTTQQKVDAFSPVVPNKAPGLGQLGHMVPPEPITVLQGLGALIS